MSLPPRGFTRLFRYKMVSNDPRKEEDQEEVRDTTNTTTNTTNNERVLLLSLPVEIDDDDVFFKVRLSSKSSSSFEAFDARSK